MEEDMDQIIKSLQETDGRDEQSIKEEISLCETLTIGQRVLVGGFCLKEGKTRETWINLDGTVHCYFEII